MEFGSVKFFKALILTVTALLILIPTILSLVFGINSAILSSRLKELKAQQASSNSVSLNLSKSETEQNKPPSPEPTSQAQPSFDYQAIYENLYVEPPASIRENLKVAYLTFDDGPSANTEKILTVLEEQGIKATFFVTGPASERNPERLKAITDAGHKIAVHTYSHKYAEIYSSVEAYLADFEKMHTIIEQATGIKTNIFRFPGGSINNYNRAIYEPIIAEMTRRGFVYFDWNVSSGDVAAGSTKNAITNNVLTGSAKQRGSSIILMHDRDDMNNTLAALPQIIEGLKEQGYTFDMLENDVRQFSFAYQK